MCKYLEKGGFPHVAFTQFLLCSDKNLLRQPVYHYKDLILLFQMVFSFFVKSFFLGEIFLFEKHTRFRPQGASGTRGVVASDTIPTYCSTTEFVTDDVLPEQVFMPADVGFHSRCVSLEYHTSVFRPIMPVQTLLGHWSNPKINFVFVIHLNLAKPVTNTLKSC